MAQALRVGAVLQVPDERIGESVIDEVFDAATSEGLAQRHPMRSRCDRFVARDPGDNMIVLRDGVYHYWDHESDTLIKLGSDPADFVVGQEE